MAQMEEGETNNAFTPRPALGEVSGSGFVALLQSSLNCRYLGVTGTIGVHVLNNWVLRILVVVIIVQVLGKYMIMWYLDP